MNVDKLMTYRVQCCYADDSLNDAAWVMWERDCGVVPVIDEDSKVVGVVTDRDIAMAALLEGKSLRHIAVSTAMSDKPIVIEQNQPLSEATRLMREHQIRRLPVTDAEGQLTGMLSLNDVILATGDTAKEAKELVATLAGISAQRSEESAAVSEPPKIAAPTQGYTEEQRAN